MLLRPQDIAAARSCEFLREGQWSEDPAENLAWCEAELDRLGYRIVPKGRLEPARKRTTTLNALKQIRTGRGFEARPTSERAEVLGHELVHVRADVRVVPYAAARYRLVHEVPAHREQLRIAARQRRYDYGRALIVAKRMRDNLAKRYLVGTIDAGARALVLDILMDDWA